MAVEKFVYDVLDAEKQKVLALTDTEVTRLAQEIAFYTTMIWAAKDDPMDDSEEQAEMLDVFRTKLDELTETYANRVNDLI